MLDQLKIFNLTNIMTVLLSMSEGTKAELVQNTGLSNSTVSASVNDLMKLGLLTPNGLRDSDGGRRSTIYTINRDFGSFVGVDIRRDALSFVITDCQGRMKDAYDVPLKLDQPTIILLMDEIEHLLRKQKNVLGVGIGLDGKIDYKRQIVIDCAACDWSYVPLKEILERRFDTFFLLDHRANGAGIGEHLRGRGRGLSDFICVFETSQEKASVILDGQVLRGAENYAGAFIGGNAFFERLAAFVRIFDAAFSLVGYQTEGFRDAAEQAIASEGRPYTLFIQNEKANAAGMAVAAQKEWFQSVYFMLL